MESARTLMPEMVLHGHMLAELSWLVREMEASEVTVGETPTTGAVYAVLYGPGHRRQRYVWTGMAWVV